MGSKEKGQGRRACIYLYVCGGGLVSGLEGVEVGAEGCQFFTFIDPV